MPVTTWTAGQVLAAQDLNDTFASKVDYALPANAQSGTGASAYTFVLADASRLTTATGTSAKTFTIPPQANVAWVANSIIRVANYGTGDLTIAGGSGVTVTNASKTLAQFESAALVRTGSNAWTLIPFSGGAGNADFSDAADGTYTDGGVTWKWKRYTASSTLTITKSGFADVLVVGGGAGSGFQNTIGCGGGGAGGVLVAAQVYLPAATHTVTVGAGGAAGYAATIPGYPGDTSRLGFLYATGGGGGRADITATNTAGYQGGSGGGGYGGGAGNQGAGGAGVGGLGNAGGTGFGSVTSTARAGGGGGGAGAAGTNAASAQGGNGGNGVANNYTGTSVTYGGGGGGGSTGGSAGSGGTGGGGNGALTGTPTGGSANTGGGAGASQSAGSAGGSGIVIVRVRTN